MPLRLGKKVFDDFDSAVEYVRRVKKIPVERARAYVATIEREQKHGAKKKKKR